jgi:ribosomal protein L40E
MEEQKDYLENKTILEESQKVVPDQPAEQVPEAEPEKVFCVKCGAEVAPGNVFCPKCGHKVGEKLAADNTSSQANTNLQPKAPKKKMIGIIIGALVAIAAIVAIILFARGVQAKDITLNKKNASVKVGEIVSLSYTINPSDTKDKTVTWTSSNELIAQVNGGTITGVNEGDCTITVSTKNGKTDTCTITVLPAGPDLPALYNEYCTSTFATVANDGSYLSVDTNPDDEDEYFDYEAYAAIVAINEALGLPESVLNRMNQTRSMDGIQSYSTDELEITWTYHPDKGMEVNYTIK